MRARALFQIVLPLALFAPGCGGGGGAATDTTPPAAPTGLVAKTGDSLVFLTWEENGEPDLAGYLLYRLLPTDSAPVLQAPDPIDWTFAWDGTTPNDVEATYTVTAVDTQGNESAGTSVTATPRAPVPYAGSGFTVDGLHDSDQAAWTVGLDPSTMEFTAAGQVWVHGDDGIALVGQDGMGNPEILQQAQHPTGAGVTSTNGFKKDIRLDVMNLDLERGWCEVSDGGFPDHGFLADADPEGWTEETQFFRPFLGLQRVYRRWTDPVTQGKSCMFALIGPNTEEYYRFDLPFAPLALFELPDGTLFGIDGVGGPSFDVLRLILVTPEFEHFVHSIEVPPNTVGAQLDRENGYFMYASSSDSALVALRLDLVTGDLKAIQSTKVSGTWQELVVGLRADSVLHAHQRSSAFGDLCALSSVDWDGNELFGTSMRTTPGAINAEDNRPVAFWNLDGATPVLRWERIDGLDPVRPRPFTAFNPTTGVEGSMIVTSAPHNEANSEDVVQGFFNLIVSGVGPAGDKVRVGWSPSGSTFGTVLKSEVTVHSFEGLLWGDRWTGSTNEYFGVANGLGPPPFFIWTYAPYSWGVEGSNRVIHPWTARTNGASKRYCLGTFNPDEDLSVFEIGSNDGLVAGCMQDSVNDGAGLNVFMAYTPPSVSSDSGTTAAAWVPVLVPYTPPAPRPFTIREVALDFGTLNATVTGHTCP